MTERNESGADRPPEFSRSAAFVEARRMLAPLRRALAFEFSLAVAIAAAMLLPALRALPIVRALAPTGIPAILCGALLLAATALFATSQIARARWLSVSLSSPTVRQAGRWRRLLPRRRVSEYLPVSAAARRPQAVRLIGGAALAALAIARFWPMPAPPVALAPQIWFGLAGAALVLGFPLLVAERVFAGTDPLVLPEAPRLRAMLAVPIAACLMSALLALADGLGLAAPWTHWARIGACGFLLGIAAELAMRGIGLCFLPPPEPEAARASIGSFLATLLQPAGASPTAIAATIRERFGIDFARSWALSYTRRAFPPVLLLMLVIGWGLTGLTEIGLDQRGSYERLGAPVAILKPGLHLLLPWPFGRVRRVEYGVVHSVEVSFGDGAQAAAPPAPDTSSAEGPAPASANRLWDQALDTDVSYIIASKVSGRQSFETVSVNLRVLYRIGLDDASARHALYDDVAPARLVSTVAGRLLAHFFADRTLNDALGENRDRIARGLRSNLQSELDHLSSGVEVVAVVIEALHPPGGAAAAYRAVQAAEIAARTSIAEERGRAESTASIARRDAAQTIADADAGAAAEIGAAEVQLRQMRADDDAYRAAGRAFLVERYFADLRAALAQSSLELVDHRLAGASAPTLDLRPPGSDPLATGTAEMQK